MGVTIRDASLTTARRRQVAYFSWRLGKGDTVKSEQAPSNGFQQAGPSASVPQQAYIGAQLIGQATQPSTDVCSCSSAVTMQGYDKKSPAC